MTTSSRLYIGIMSGTSVDSVDTALVRIGRASELLLTHSHPLPSDIRQNIFSLFTAEKVDLNSLGQLDVKLGKVFAEATRALIEKSPFSHTDIEAIGSHGQTIRHQPYTTTPFSLQIGDPNTIAYLTGITTVADFRRKDIAAGGQGAPLVPAFHKDQFALADKPRCIVNIGGMANITLLREGTDTVGFDTGPGNVLLDSWIQQSRNLRFDKDGQWANRGTVDQRLLQALLAHPYFNLPYPKSTGRETFNLQWLNQIVKPFLKLTPQNIQSTLAEFTALSIANAINQYSDASSHIYVCGGGTHNTDLIDRLQKALPKHTMNSTQALGIHPDWVEAVAFAWLASRTLKKATSNLPAATGARSEEVLGTITYA